MFDRYSIFTPYHGTYASQYEEDMLQLFSLIKCLQPDIPFTFRELDSALIQTGLSPRLLYEHASAGRYTPDMARLDAALGLPTKDVTIIEEAASALENVSGLSYAECLHIMQQFTDKVPSAQMPVLPARATEKVPYYQKNKGKWWK